MRKFSLRIILPSILSVLLFILTIFFIVIPRFQENIMNGKREMIKELTNSAWSILAKYENDEREGILTREEAQKTAISRIQYLRYGEENKDYFWITDMTPNMIMHPFRKDLDGKDLTDFKDPHGKRLFVEFVNTVKKSQQGYVDYMWQWKDDLLHIVPKLSYVKVFKPWNWVIGTGIYIEDVKREISTLTKSMLWISVGISILIAFLLMYILKQSLNVEKKRISAENDLHESKEKFRTLVEAATEGILMLIDGKISFSNNVINKMTGYDSQELAGRSLIEIISRSNNENILQTFSQNTIKEGQYELNIGKKNGGLTEALVTCSTTVFYGQTVNILVIKDISIDKGINVTTLDYQKLINTLNIGFFKARIDQKGRFLFANETAIRIFGFEDFKQLSEVHLLGLISDHEERKALHNDLLDKGFIKNKIVKILNGKDQTSIVAFSLVLMTGEDSEDLICDGIVEDITLQQNEKSQFNNLITELKAKDFILERPVKEYLNSIHTLDADSTIQDAVEFLLRKKTEALLLTRNEIDYLGIITKSDIQKRIFALNLKLDNPAYLIMSSPIHFISENEIVLEAIRICRLNGINHLIVRNETGVLKGVFSINDAFHSVVNSQSFYLTNLSKAETVDDLQQCFKSLQLLTKPLIRNDFPVQYITKIISAFSDAAIKRIIELAIIDQGEPPAKFSFICLGSEGRKEETFLTDQDNAIIYEDVQIEKEEIARAYFLKLGERVCNTLNQIGYSFCLGNIMAKNPKWCAPVSVWQKHFISWIATPEAQNLLDASVFFDFRGVYGDEILVDRLRALISGAIKESPLFLYHLAYNTSVTRCQQLSSGNILSDKHIDSIDLKQAVIPIIMLARTYALQNNIWKTNTVERLNSLKENQIIAEKTVDDIVFGYNFLMKMRFRNQVELLDSHEAVTNILNTKKLSTIELNLLKKVLTNIPDYQIKIKTDFKIST
ncbi:MAG: cache domain-containing protein [Bacteroidales bacterium]|nr:cache domain-containing protein [Bacteroidales bacterium]